MAALLTAGIVVAAEIPQAERRSGYTFMGPDTKAMQDDDTANPGMLWVLDGETLWKRKAGTADKACADCHSDARQSMKGVAARHPAYDKSLGRPVDLEQRINLCRVNHQQAKPFAPESRELLALTAFVAQQSRGMPIETTADPQLEPFVAKGRELFMQRQGQLNLGCTNCHDDNSDKKLAGSRDHASASDRLSDLSSGVAIAGFAAAAAARLHHRHPRPGVRLWRAGTGRARALSDVTRPRHEDGDAGGTALIFAGV